MPEVVQINKDTYRIEDVKSRFYLLVGDERALLVDSGRTTTNAKEIVEQIVKEIKVKISPDQTSMEMVLTPETLGKVNLTVSAKHGVMTAHLVTQTQAAKEAIESQIGSICKELPHL